MGSTLMNSDGRGDWLHAKKIPAMQKRRTLSPPSARVWNAALRPDSPLPYRAKAGYPLTTSDAVFSDGNDSLARRCLCAGRPQFVAYEVDLEQYH